MRRSRANLRTPRESDLASVFKVAQEFHAASWYSHTDFSHGRIAKIFDMCRDENENMFGRIIADEKHDACVGFIVGGATEHYWSGARFAMDLAFYIQPEYRTFRIAKMALEAFEDWARRVAKVEDILVGVSSGIQPDRTYKLYEKMGYAGSFRGMRKKTT